jgi:hypothetical protein
MKFRLIPLFLVLFSHVSFAEPWRIPLITNGYDIVTGEDIDEIEEDCAAEPFPPMRGCTIYWQCLSTKVAKVTCKDTGPDLSPSFPGHHSEFVMTLKKNEETQKFLTRHSGTLFECKQDRKDILIAMKNEKIVCVSGEYDFKEGNTVYWTIDRVKSRHGEWSWFTRDKKKSKRKS